MNKELEYQHLVKMQSLVRDMAFQREDEVYTVIKDYLRRADAFVKGDILNDTQIALMNNIQKTLDNNETALVRVRGDWYQVRVVMFGDKVLVLDKRLPEVAESYSGDRVFVWEVSAYVNNQGS